MRECIKCLLTYDDEITVCPTCGSETVIVPDGWKDIREPEVVIPEIYDSDIAEESVNTAYSGSSFDMYDPDLGSMRFRPANVGRIRYVAAPERTNRFEESRERRRAAREERRIHREERRRQRAETLRQAMPTQNDEELNVEESDTTAQREDPRATRRNNLRNNLSRAGTEQNANDSIGGFTPRQNNGSRFNMSDGFSAARNRTATFPRRPRRNGRRLPFHLMLANSTQTILPIIVLIATLIFVIANRAVIGQVLMIFMAAWAVLFVLMLLLLRRSMMRDSIVTLTTIGAIIATLVIYNVGGIGSTIGVFINAIMPAVIIVFTLYLLLRSFIR